MLKLRSVMQAANIDKIVHKVYYEDLNKYKFSIMIFIA